MSPCATCGGRWSGLGPCPGCGEAPAIELLAAEVDQGAAEPRRVSTPSSLRRRVAAVVAAVVALVGLSIAMSGGGDEPGSADDADATSTTTRPRGPRRTTTSTLGPPVSPGDPVRVEAVDGFEDEWLLVVESNGAIWQLPLGGGESQHLGTSQVGQLDRLVDGTLFGYEGGLSLRDGTVWRAFPRPGGGHWPVGITSDDTLLTFDGERFVELGRHGEPLAERDAPPLEPAGAHPVAVTGRQVIFQSIHGIARFDLDTGQLRRIATGSFIAATPAGQLVVTACDDALRCDDRVIDAISGETRAVFEERIIPLQDLRMWMTPTASPDGDRLAVITERGLLVVDLRSGGVVGEIPVPDELGPSGSRNTWMNLQVSWTAASDRLIVVALLGNQSGAGDVVWIATADRELQQVEAEPQLAEAVQRLAPANNGLAAFVTTERFEPVLAAASS